MHYQLICPLVVLKNAASHAAAPRFLTSHQNVTFLLQHDTNGQNARAHRLIFRDPSL